MYHATIPKAGNKFDSCEILKTRGYYRHEKYDSCSSYPIFWRKKTFARSLETKASLVYLLQNCCNTLSVHCWAYASPKIVCSS